MPVCMNIFKGIRPLLRVHFGHTRYPARRSHPEGFVRTWTNADHLATDSRHTNTHPPKTATDSFRSKLPPLYVSVSPVASLLRREAGRAWIDENVYHSSSYGKIRDRGPLLFQAPRSPSLASAPVLLPIRPCAAV